MSMLPQSSDSAANDPKQPKKKRASSAPPASSPLDSGDKSPKSVSSEVASGTTGNPPAKNAITVEPSPDRASEPPPEQSVGEVAPIESGDAAPSTTESSANRGKPIPPPSEPMQYRAIGLVKGRYIASASQFTQGILLTTDGTVIDAVLLGRIMSLVKNHLNLEEEHLWVVYPRTRQNDGNLHTQILGVWEPETLAKSPIDSPATPEETTASSQEEPVIDGYFSIRGEVIFQSVEQEYLVVKIRQAPRKPTDKPKYFKLKLKGKLAAKAVGYFWDLQVQRQAEALVIESGEEIGLVSAKPKKSFKPRKPGGGGGRPGFSKKPSGPPMVRKGPPLSESAPTTPKPPVTKPVVKRRPPDAPSGG